MSKKILIFLLLSYSLTCISQDMTFKKLKLTLAKKATVKDEKDNVIHYELDGVVIYLITDENSNRMRLMAGVIEQNKLTKEDLEKLLEANYDKALDAKYALSNDILWSAFTHPLKELTAEQATDALYQVKNLVNNYGSSYHSTDIVFGGN